VHFVTNPSLSSPITQLNDNKNADASCLTIQTKPTNYTLLKLYKIHSSRRRSFS